MIFHLPYLVTVSEDGVGKCWSREGVSSKPAKAAAASESAFKIKYILGIHSVKITLYFYNRYSFMLLRMITYPK
jgi:hypothetical protein